MAISAPFGLAVITFASVPVPVGYQDLASLIASRSALGARPHDAGRATAFSALRTAIFSFPQPVGSAIPEPAPYRVASLAIDASDVTGAVPYRDRALFDLSARAPDLDRDFINRARKGDRIVPRAEAEWRREQQVAAESPFATEPPTEVVAATAPKAAAADQRRAWPRVLPAAETAVAAAAVARKAEVASAGRPASAVTVAPLPREAYLTSSMAWLGTEPEAEPAPAAVAAAPATPTAEAAVEPTKPIVLASASADIPLPRAVTPQADLAGPPDRAAEPLPRERESYRPDTAVPSIGDTGTAPTLSTARIYFGADSLADTDALQPWNPAHFVLGDPETELAPGEPAEAGPRLAAIEPNSGQTIAAKGVVMPGDGHGLRSPAERLGLAGEDRGKAERCLADAIYFESRGEPERGQIAVAQVVMNRVFSGYYPSDVCGVVYQNAHRHLSCQFTFACDGIKDKITEPDAWERAQRLARETLDGRHWLPDVGKATHYHAYWVRPWWVRTMHKLDKIGVHTFYRPRNWGDGADRPTWGDAPMPPPAEKLSSVMPDGMRSDPPPSP